jgi:hypothetical protein
MKFPINRHKVGTHDTQFIRVLCSGDMLAVFIARAFHYMYSIKLNLFIIIIMLFKQTMFKAFVTSFRISVC